MLVPRQASPAEENSELDDLAENVLGRVIFISVAGNPATTKRVTELCCGHRQQPLTHSPLGLAA
jgi:hypothetical protein